MFMSKQTLLRNVLLLLKVRNVLLLLKVTNNIRVEMVKRLSVENMRMKRKNKIKKNMRKKILFNKNEKRIRKSDEK